MNETLSYLTSGQYFNAFVSVYYNILGVWFYLALLLIVDLAVGLKSKNAVLTIMINLVLMVFFSGMLPLMIDKIILIVSSLVFGGIIFLMLK